MSDIYLLMKADMDDAVKSVTCTLLESSKNCLDMRYRQAIFTAAEIITFSRISGSKLEVMVGETLESSLYQFTQSILELDISDEQISKELSEFKPFIDTLIDSIMHVTKPRYTMH